MKEIKLSISYIVYTSPDKLSEEERTLLHQAEDTLDKAYAPYSGYHVGAALLLANGKVFSGGNQENVAFPSGMCAERVALFYASSQYPEEPVKAIAITAKSADFSIDQPVTPCGACRQVMAETENRLKSPIKLILKGESEKVIVVEGTENLLPLMFQANQLKK